MAARIGSWAFLFAGALFFVVSVIPVARGGRLDASFFTLGIAFLLLGAIKVKRSRSTTH